jgi:hypothetical protein
MGYKDALDRCFFAYNRGLERRFPFRYHIDDYNWEDTREIFRRMVVKAGWDLELPADRWFRMNHKHFKFFGGDMEILFQLSRFVYSERTMKESLTFTNLTKTLTRKDIEQAMKKFIQGREEGKEKLPISVQMMYT